MNFIEEENKKISLEREEPIDEDVTIATIKETNGIC
jgi:hypothetical protein